MSNYPVLWQNCLSVFETEIGKRAWIWFAETRGAGMLYAADKYAREVETLVLALRPMVETSCRQNSYSDEIATGVMRFVLLRHANWRLGGNVQPSFLGAE